MRRACIGPGVCRDSPAPSQELSFPIQLHLVAPPAPCTTQTKPFWLGGLTLLAPAGGVFAKKPQKKPPHFPQTSFLQRQRKEEIQRDRGGMKRCLRGWHNMTRPHAATRSPFVSEAFAPHPLPSLSQIQRLAAKTIISLQQPSRSSCAYSPLSPGEGLRHREIKWPPTSPWLQPSPVTGAQNGSPGRGFLSAFLPPPKTSES